MADPFFLEFHIQPKGDEWNAHSRRDFIEQTVEKVTHVTPDIFMRMLQTASQDIRIAMDEHPTERLFRLSFPGYASDTLKMKVSPVYPDGFVSSLHQQTMDVVKQNMLQRNQSKLALTFDWLIKKVVGQDTFKEVNQQVMDEEMHKASSNVRGNIEEIWNKASFVPFVTLMGDWLIAQGYDFNVAIHNRDQVRNISSQNLSNPDVTATNKPKP